MRIKLFLSVIVIAMIAVFAARSPAAGQAPEKPAGAPVAIDVKWTPMPIRSQKQVAMGIKGGEGGQCLHGIARSPADDRRIYLAVDVVGVWRSDDGGVNWHPCRNTGLRCLGTTSIAAHPKNADRLLTCIQANWEKPREPEEGLYESLDGGENWQRVLAAPNPDKRRGYRRLIDYSADGQRVYFLSYKNG